MVCSGPVLVYSCLRLGYITSDTGNQTSPNCSKAFQVTFSSHISVNPLQSPAEKPEI